MGRYRLAESQPSNQIRRKPAPHRAAGPGVTHSGRTPAGRGPAAADDVLAIQRTLGNRAVQRMIQAKLIVGPAGDRYEQEADRVAAQAARPNWLSWLPFGLGGGRGDPSAQRKPLAARISRLAGRPEAGGGSAMQGGGFEAGGEVESRLNARRGGGQPLADPVRADMESRFGADFGAVRLHTGGEAAQLNRQLNAQAFTYGSDIYFGSGKYNPASGGDRQLLAHELTHVIQQGGAGGGAVQPKRIQRAGGFEKFRDEQWEGWKKDMAEYGKMIKQGFVDEPAEAYQSVAPQDETQGNWFTRGARRVGGAIGAGLTGLVRGPMALALAGAGAIASTVGRGLAVGGRGVWSVMKSIWHKASNGLSALGTKFSEKWELLRGKKGKGSESEASTLRTDVGANTALILNTAVTQTLSWGVKLGEFGGVVLAAVTGPISTLIGLFKGGVNAARAHRARKRQLVAEKYAKEDDPAIVHKQLQDWIEKQDKRDERLEKDKEKDLKTDHQQFLEAVKYLGGKNALKKWRGIMQSAGAIVGAAGSAAMTGMLIAGATTLTALLASNPVGWGIAAGLIGIGLLSGIGYGLYKLIHRIRKGDQTGVNREKYANVFYDLARKGHKYAISFLTEIGVLKASEGDKRGKFTLREFENNRAQAVAYLKSKMKST